MYKMLLSAILCLSIVFTPVLVKAQDVENLKGQITTLSVNQKAPYAGILLDPVAAAKINTDKKYSLLEHELKLNYEIKKLEADYNLRLSTLQARYDSLKQSSNAVIDIKTKEISRLQEIATESPNDYAALWATLGLVAGALLSIGIFYAAVEVQE
jgi:hypothetical protein